MQSDVYDYISRARIIFSRVPQAMASLATVGAYYRDGNNRFTLRFTHAVGHIAFPNSRSVSCHKRNSLVIMARVAPSWDRCRRKEYTILLSISPSQGKVIVKGNCKISYRTLSIDLIRDAIPFNVDFARQCSLFLASVIVILLVNSLSFLHSLQKGTENVPAPVGMPKQILWESWLHRKQRTISKIEWMVFPHSSYWHMGMFPPVCVIIA